MPFLWLSIEDDAGPHRLRSYIERNSIALLSNYHKLALDPPSQSWLGHHSHRERVRKSGLWNQNHVDELYARFSCVSSTDELVLETDGARKESLRPFLLFFPVLSIGAIGPISCSPIAAHLDEMTTPSHLVRDSAYATG
jgi:hypothetical protein